MIWQNCLFVEEPRASDLAEVPVQVIWLNCLYMEEYASDLAELPVPVICRDWSCQNRVGNTLRLWSFKAGSDLELFWAFEDGSAWNL